VKVDLIVVTGRSSASLTLYDWTSRGKTDRQRPKIGNGDNMVAVMTGSMLMFEDEASEPLYQDRSRRATPSL
jgi:hypothetical protein